MRTQKVKKKVDTKASKGRKLRYTVHEKIQNFMVPVPRGTWHEEQTDDLFASLFGKSGSAVQGIAPEVAPAVLSDGFKLFG
jgi:protein AATF/BFR2